MKRLILSTFLFFMILSLAQVCLAQEALTSDNKLSSTELQNLSNELKVVEKTNNEKYTDSPNAEKFMQLFSNLSHIVASAFSKNYLNSNLIKFPVDAPKLDSSGNEIYSQKIYFKTALTQQRSLRKNGVRFKIRHKVQNDFASALQYNL